MKKTKKKVCNKKKGGYWDNSIKNIKKTIDTLYDNDPQKFMKMKELVNLICANKIDNSQDNILNYNGILKNKKNREVLIELAEKNGIHRESINKLSDRELCQRLQYHDYKGTWILSPSRPINWLEDNKNKVVHDVLRPGIFIRRVKKSIEDLILKNEIVYNSVFKNDKYITIKQKAYWLSEGAKVLEEMEELQLELRATLDAEGSTFLKDILKKKENKRVKSKYFFGSLKPDQKRELESMHQILTYNIEKTREFLWGLENNKDVRSEIKEIQKEQIEKKNLKLRQDRDHRETRQHQWKREETYDRYDDKYKDNSKFAKAIDVASEYSKASPLFENIGKETLKHKKVSDTVNTIYDNITFSNIFDPLSLVAKVLKINK